MKLEHSAGGVVLSTAGNVLVINQDGNVWSLPKGHLNAGETDRQAAERENREESGISQLRYVKDLGSYQRYQVGKDGLGEHKHRLKTIILFLYTTNQLKLAPEDPMNPDARWVDPAEVAELLTIPKDKAFFTKILPVVLGFIEGNKE